MCIICYWICCSYLNLLKRISSSLSKFIYATNSMLYSVSWELPICKFPFRSLSIHVGVCSAVIGYFNFGKTLHLWSHNNFQHKSITVIQEANKPFEQCYSSLFSAQSDEPSEYSVVGFLSSCSLCQLIVWLQTYLNHIKRQRHCEMRIIFYGS